MEIGIELYGNIGSNSDNCDTVQESLHRTLELAMKHTALSGLFGLALRDMHNNTLTRDADWESNGWYQIASVVMLIRAETVRELVRKWRNE